MPSKPATVSSDSGGATRSSGLWAATKERGRRLIAEGLYRTRLLRTLERLAARHGIRRGAPSRLMRQTPGSKFGILCYHRVGTEGVPLFSRLEPKSFEAQMRYVKQHYRVVSLNQLCCELRDATNVPPTLAITFDDGYRDLYEFAFPVLSKYEIPATIYLIGRCMETGEVPWYDRIFAALKIAPGPAFEVNLDKPRRFALDCAADRSQAAWEVVCFLRSIPDVQRRTWCVDFERQIALPQLWLEDRMLTWEQVRTMHRAGISFGAHTMSHPVVSQLDPSAFHEEFVRSRELLELSLGAEIPDFAYPFGKPADRSLLVEKFLESCGYRSAVTTSQGYNTRDSSLYRLLRLQVGEGQSMAEFAFELCRMFLESSTQVPACSPESELPEILSTAAADTTAR